MAKKLNYFMLLLTVIAVVTASAINTTAAYADDGVPTSEPTEPAPVEEPAVVEEPVPAETVEAILNQIPEGTDLVVLNDAGEVEPLATEAAAQIIVSGDPIWCPSTPGAGGCTSSYSDFASLIGALATDSASATPLYTGDGTIWVENTYAGNDNAQIGFDGSVLTSLHNLTIQGGWDGSAAGNISGTSMADVSMFFVNWTGDITLNDLDIAAADGAGFGLLVQNTGNVTLDNVSVHDTTNFGDGAFLFSTGDVDITNSEFDNNTGNGLRVFTTGAIALDTVSASNNTFTGAYLDSCLYGFVTAGLCAGNGVVTITSTTANLFNTNGFDGLVVDAGGGIGLDHVQADSNGLDGTVLTSADDDGTGNVSVDYGEFNDNSNGTGLDVLTDGNIALTNSHAYSNDTGAILDTTLGIGEINVAAANFGIDTITGNTWTGLHAESGGGATLVSVTASFNGTNGAYVTAEGDIMVLFSTFNDNVHFNYPQDPGLYAASNGGDITLATVTADGNDFGAGAVLLTKDNGLINVTGGQFNGNGTFGVQAQAEDGDLKLNSVTASFNLVKGTYLSASGMGNIFVNSSTFVENGSYGIYAGTAQGDVNLNLVTVTGDNSIDDGAPGADDLTDYGAVLVTGNGGSVFVNDSAFNLNTEVGLQVIAGGPVSLVNVTADQNGGNGVEIYSTSTAGSMCPGEEVVSITVDVDGGTFTNNGDYGLMVKPGPAGTLVFVTPSTFGGNGLGDYLLDLSNPSQSEDCGGHGDKPPVDSKRPHIVDVPSSGGPAIEQDCELYSSTILRLPNGTTINVGCPFAGFSNLEEVLLANLPGKLGAGTNFAAAVNVSLTDPEGNATVHEDGSITINFKLPEGSRGRGYSIMFWDPTLNDGQGGWVKLPLYEAGTTFPLNPDDPGDTRTIISGVQQIGDTITVTVNFPGVFVLVAR